jgi:hypothetical protein
VSRPSKTSSMDSAKHGDMPMELGQVGNEDNSRDSDTESGIETLDACSDGLDRLEKKLREPKATRAEIDQDIAMIEGTLGLVEDNSN